MRIALVIIGDEILDGLREDKNFRIALNILGKTNKISTVIFVRDNLEELKKTLQCVKDLADVVITSGGLGLTPDDITLRAFSVAFGIELIRNPEKKEVAKKNIERGSAFQYNNFIDELSIGLSGSTPIENPVGVAAGEKIKIGNTTFYILPGVPKEFEVMVKIIANEFKKDLKESKIEYEVNEKEANLIKTLRGLEEKFGIRTASYPPIEQGEKLKIILYGNEIKLKEAKEYFESELKEAQIYFEEKSPSHTS